MHVPMPNLNGARPGRTSMATMMMKQWMGKASVATIPELVDLCFDADVRMVGCQMTMDVMGVKREDLLDRIEIGGAATYLDYAADADISLFI